MMDYKSMARSHLDSTRRDLSDAKQAYLSSHTKRQAWGEAPRHSHYTATGPSSVRQPSRNGPHKTQERWASRVAHGAKSMEDEQWRAIQAKEKALEERHTIIEALLKKCEGHHRAAPLGMALDMATYRQKQSEEANRALLAFELNRLQTQSSALDQERQQLSSQSSWEAINSMATHPDNKAWLKEYTSQCQGFLDPTAPPDRSDLNVTQTSNLSYRYTQRWDPDAGINSKSNSPAKPFATQAAPTNPNPYFHPTTSPSLPHQLGISSSLAGSSMFAGPTMQVPGTGLGLGGMASPYLPQGMEDGPPSNPSVIFMPIPWSPDAPFPLQPFTMRGPGDAPMQIPNGTPNSKRGKHKKKHKKSHRKSRRDSDSETESESQSSESSEYSYRRSSRRHGSHQRSRSGGSLGSPYKGLRRRREDHEDPSGRDRVRDHPQVSHEGRDRKGRKKRGEGRRADREREEAREREEKERKEKEEKEKEERERREREAKEREEQEKREREEKERKEREEREQREKEERERKEKEEREKREREEKERQEQERKDQILKEIMEREAKKEEEAKAAKAKKLEDSDDDNSKAKKAKGKSKEDSEEEEEEEEEEEDQEDINDYVGGLDPGTALWCLNELIEAAESHMEDDEEPYSHILGKGKKKTKRPVWEEREKLLKALVGEKKIKKFSATVKGQAMLDIVAHVGGKGLLPVSSDLNAKFLQKDKQCKRATIEDNIDGDELGVCWQVLLNHVHAIVNHDSKSKDRILKAIAQSLTTNWTKAQRKKNSTEGLPDFVGAMAKTKSKDTPEIKSPSELAAAKKKKKSKKAADSDDEEEDEKPKKSKKKAADSDEEEEEKPKKPASGLGNNSLGFLKPKPKNSRLMMGGSGGFAGGGLGGGFGGGGQRRMGTMQKLQALGNFDDDFGF